MPSPIEKLIADSRASIDIDGVRWHYKTVRSIDIIKADYNRLSFAATNPEILNAERSLRLSSLPPDMLDRELKMREALVVAGVTAVQSLPDGEIVPVQMTRRSDEEDAAGGILAVTTLRVATFNALYQAIWDLTTAGGEATRVARTFRKEQDCTTDSAQDSEILRAETA